MFNQKNTQKFVSCLLLSAGLMMINSANAQSVMVDTQVSNKIALKEATSNNKTLYFSVKNESKQDSNLEGKLRKVFQERGFSIVDSPKKANYVLKSSVRQAGNIKKTDLNRAVAQGSFSSKLPSINEGHRGKASTYAMIVDMVIYEHSKDEKSWNLLTNRAAFNTSQSGLNFVDATTALEKEAAQYVANIF